MSRVKQLTRRTFLVCALSLMALAPQLQNCQGGGGGPSGDGGGGFDGRPADSGPAIPDRGAAFALPESRVAMVRASKARASDLTEGDIQRLVAQAVAAAGGLAGLVRDGQTVVIKPNLVFTSDLTLSSNSGRPLPPEVNGVTTDWRVTKAVVGLVRKLNPGGKVYVMEGSVAPTRSAFKALGYTGDKIPGVDAFLAIEEDSGAFGDKDSAGLVKVALADGQLNKEYYLNRKIKQADVLISLPTLKNHWNAVVTGAVKNIGIGATPANIYGATATYHLRTQSIDHQSRALHQWIRDFYRCRPADFVVMDGLQGLQNGPVPSKQLSGTTELKQDQMNMRLVLAGKDALAVDTVASLVMGWNPGSVEHLRLLGADRAGNTDPLNIRVVGQRVDQVRQKFAGSTALFSHGGAPVKDTTPPRLSVSSQRLTGARLVLQLGPDADLRRLELFAGGTYLGRAIVTDSGPLVFDLSGLGAGTHSLTLHGFDASLNHARQTLSVTIGAGE
jgi:uncharacterized protein (DUF362 family)